VRWFLLLGTSALVLILDQATKWKITSSLAPSEVVPLTGFFSLVNVRNRGAAFGFLSDPAISWQFWLFCAATLLALGIIWLVVSKARPQERLLFCALGGISGGALGNFVDRLRFRAVIDFLDLHYHDWHWPAFNLADMAICAGAFAAAFLFLRPEASFVPSADKGGGPA
jgi:signal peptidase II